MLNSGQFYDHNESITDNKQHKRAYPNVSSACSYSREALIARLIDEFVIGTSHGGVYC